MKSVLVRGLSRGLCLAFLVLSLPAARLIGLAIGHALHPSEFYLY